MSAYGGRPTVFQPVLNNMLKPVGRRLAEMLTSQEVQKSPQLADHHGTAQCFRTAPNCPGGWECNRGTPQDCPRLSRFADIVPGGILLWEDIVSEVTFGRIAFLHYLGMKIPYLRTPCSGTSLWSFSTLR